MVCLRMHARAGRGGTDQRKCGGDMKCRDRSSDSVLRYDPDVIAVIEDSDELKRILRHLGKIGRSPPGFDPDRLNRHVPPIGPLADVCLSPTANASVAVWIRLIRA